MRFLSLATWTTVLAMAAPMMATRVVAGEPVFVECSGPAGIAVTHQPSLAFTPGQSLGSFAPMIGGGAVADFDGDGHQDIFMPMSGGAPDHLFLNNADGTFSNAASVWHVAETHLGVGASAGDFDNDGRLDVYVTSLGETAAAAGSHRLYHNHGRHFLNVAQAAGVATTSPILPDGLGSAFGDYDLDGDLDLFVASWRAGSQGNRLFRNNGNGTFSDVTDAAGIDANAVLVGPGFVRGFSPRFVDMNGDRYPELLIAADFGTSQYYRNNGDGTLTEHTAGSGTGLDDNGMGHTIADFDGNGLLDWYVTSIYSPRPIPGVPGTGNMLYLNQGNHVFVEASEPNGVKDGGWGWGTVAIDFNHDRWTDIVETNGWTTGPNDLEWLHEASYAYQNLGGGAFVEVGSGIGIDHHTLLGRGLANLDFDNDGDQDLLVFSYADELRLYRNDLSGPDTNWLRVFLDTRAVPDLAPHGFGAKVSARTSGFTQWKHLDGGSNYLSQSELSVHFGLSDSVSVDRLRVEWANGKVTELTDVAANQTLTVRAAPDFVRGDCDGDAVFAGLTDGLFLLAYAFVPGSAVPDCPEACDVDDNGQLSGISDGLYLLNHQFAGGPPPALPYPSCGSDPRPVPGLSCGVNLCP